MALGRHKTDKQRALWITTSKLARSPGHPFYELLNRCLAKAGFDRYVEDICAPYYAEELGRPCIPPGVYFRMLFIGYFEGIDSQRGIAWRVSDSLSLREFLGYELSERTPDHSTLTVIRQRLPLDLHHEVFQFVLRVANNKGLLKGKTLGVDSTTLEANAAMKSIVRRDTGRGWNEYVRALMAAEGIEEPTDDELRNFDCKRPHKKVSNKAWKSATDADSRIAKMKDGRTRLAYKANHAVDFESELIVAASVTEADQGDADSLAAQIEEAEDNLFEADTEPEVKEVVADKGYHKTEVLADCAQRGVRTYIAERKSRRRRKWSDKPAGWQEAYYGNRRRSKAVRGKAIQRTRSEVLERSFAHVCDTGGTRRSWLRGLIAVNKKYVIVAAAHNLAIVMRQTFGYGKPKALQGAAKGLLWALCRATMLLRCVRNAAMVGVQAFSARMRRVQPIAWPTILLPAATPKSGFSTGC
jgi:transposase